MPVFEAVPADVISRPLDPSLEAVLQCLPGLARMLGERYEVILHDLRHPDSSVVSIIGSITGRKIGSPITNYVLQTLHKYGDEAPDRISYRTYSNDGRVLRSSTLFIRDKRGSIVGCLCFNQDISDYMTCLELMQKHTEFTDIASPSTNGHMEEHFTYDITDTMQIIVRSILEKYPKLPANMHRDEKIEVVQKLEENGVFNIKGAVEYVASQLSVSTYTVYNYLKAIRE